jgi:CRISPR-associated protein (Cas_Cmr5)
MKQTLSQLRAANALESSRIPEMGYGQEGGDALSGFPMLIKTDGAMAAFASAVERRPDGNRKQLGKCLIVDAIAKHLSSLRIVVAETADDLVEELAGGDTYLLRRTTAEGLAFLNYLKRFVK